jgi:O-antigen/teichoic acid export membrane protein
MEKKGAVDLSTTRVISDSFFYSVARGLVLIVKPVKGILLGNLLGPRLYGILNIPVPYLQISNMLSNIGYNTSILKLMPGYLQEERPDLARMIYRSSAFLTLVLSTLWAALLIVFSPWIAQHIAHEPAVVNPMRMYALIIPFLAVNTFFAAAYLAVQRGKLGAAISFVYGMLNTLLPIAAVLWRRHVTLVVGSMLAAEAIGAALYTYYFHEKVLAGFKAAAGPLWRGIKETSRFGFLFFLSGLGWNLILSIDRLMIKYYYSSEILGYYSMGAQIITVLLVVPSTLGFALVPSLTAARDAGERGIFQRLIHSSARIGFMAVVPIAVAVFALSPDIFHLLLPRYGPSVIVVQILIAIAFIELVGRIGWSALVAHGRGGLTAVAYILAAVWNIVMNRIFIPLYGNAGAAAVALSTFVILACLLLAMMKRVSGASLRVMSVVHPLLLSLGYVLVWRLLQGWESLPRLIVVGVAGTLIYAFAALLTGLVRKEDLANVREMLLPRAAVPYVRFALAAVGVAERTHGFFNSKRINKT